MRFDFLSHYEIFEFWALHRVEGFVPFLSFLLLQAIGFGNLGEALGVSSVSGRWGCSCAWTVVDCVCLHVQTTGPEVRCLGAFFVLGLASHFETIMIGCRVCSSAL